MQWGLRAEENGPARPTRVYADLDEALKRFRLLPEQPCQHSDVIQYIATQSLKQVEGGWTWKFDPAMYDYLEICTNQPEKLMALDCPTAFLLAENSEDYDPRSIDYTRQITKGKSPVYHIPSTHHHYMFDEPMAIVGAIKGTLLAWQANIL